jgi:hypothetical protein
MMGYKLNGRNEAMAVKLSKPSKMPCKTWSLEAGTTCPGSVDRFTKQVIAVCSGCYAKDGFYNMPDSKRVRDFNREDWKRAEWVNDMIAALAKEKYFRWFDSGDVYHPALAFKIFLVMQGTPHVKHWLPTKSYNIAKIRPLLERMKALPNVSVRYSSPSMTGEFNEEHGSTVVPYAETPTDATLCGAYTRSGKCGDCRACWNKEVAVIAYPAHGSRMMAKVRRLKNAA